MILFLLSFCTLPLCLPVPDSLPTGKPVTAKTSLPSPSTGSSLQSVGATLSNRNTFLDIDLRGKTLPVLSGMGKDWQITFPNTTASPELAAHLSSGGLVMRLGLETATAPRRELRLLITLRESAEGELMTAPDRKTLRLRFTPEAEKSGSFSASPVFASAAPGVYDVDAYQADVSSLLSSLAREAGASVVIAGTVERKVTVSIRRSPFEQALTLLTRSAGLAFRKEGSTYLVGTAKEIDEMTPKPPVQAEVKPPAPVMKQEVYRCQHIVAAELVRSLEKMFEKETLRIAQGAAAYSPRLNDMSTATVTGIQSTQQTNGTTSTQDSGGLVSRDVILYGEQSLVERALAIAAKLDTRRTQVRIGVKITDINSEALRELGVRWNWSNYAVREIPNVLPDSGSGTSGGSSGATTTNPLVGGVNFGSFGHDPVFVEATLSALEKSDRAKLLAAPTLSLLDGERGFILIGDRLIFPKLIGYTQAQTPIFDKSEERVGIYLQVAVQTESNGEITLTIYPQVSVVTNFLNINGASYPQISTREQQTTIRVKDGEKIIVGGLIRDEELNNVERVPLLSRIPLFGELFTYRKKTRRKSEVVIMITPEILKD